MRNFSRPEDLGQLGVEPLHVGVEDGLLAGLGDVRLELGLGLVVGLLDPRRMDAAVLQELLERHPGDLAADAVEGAQDDGVGRVVDDEVDAGQVLERADVAALAPDDAALHVVARELDDRDRRLGRMAGRQALHRDAEDRAHAALRVTLGLLLDLADDPHRVVARLVLDLLEERLLGLARAQARGALERTRRVRAHRVGVLALADQRRLAVLQLRCALLELRRAAVEGGLARLRALVGELRVSRGHAVGNGVRAAAREQECPTQEARCHEGPRDDLHHLRVLSPLAACGCAAPGLR